MDLRDPDVVVMGAASNARFQDVRILNKVACRWGISMGPRGFGVNDMGEGIGMPQKLGR